MGLPAGATAACTHRKAQTDATGPLLRSPLACSDGCPLPTPSVSGGDLDKLPFVSVGKVVQTLYSKIQMIKRAVAGRCIAALPSLLASPQGPLSHVPIPGSSPGDVLMTGALRAPSEKWLARCI